MFLWSKEWVHCEQIDLSKSNSVRQNTFNRTAIKIFNFENGILECRLKL